MRDLPRWTARNRLLQIGLSLVFLLAPGSSIAASVALREALPPQSGRGDALPGISSRYN